MNREEYYKTRQFWRTAQAMVSSKPLGVDHRNIDKVAQRHEVWSLLCQAVYHDAPLFIEECKPKYIIPKILVEKAVSKSEIRMNIKFAPNSFPHKTKNP